MVHGLAQQLGGTLEIHSAPGVGTNVEFWLPFSSHAATRVTSKANEAGDASGRGTVLLVDDDELVRTSAAETLLDLGYQVVEASSGLEALDVVASGAIVDFLVTDHLMPGITGSELIGRVRELRPNLPALLISGYSQGDDLDVSISYLTKPFRRADLFAKLQQLST